jgi:hypothetical protein
VKILKEAAAAANKAVAIISCDEKPGIPAIATTAPDLPPEPGVHATFAREFEYERLLDHLGKAGGASGRRQSKQVNCNSRCWAVMRRSSPISSRRESKFAPRLRHHWANSNARFLRAIC